jgi:hypothetical protein
MLSRLSERTRLQDLGSQKGHDQVGINPSAPLQTQTRARTSKAAWEE